MRRIAELDGVRGLAAVSIVVYHIFWTRLPWGWAGVDVFFVLSGCLITTIVLEHGGSPQFLSTFYARRGLRIWPIYYLLLLLLVLFWNGEPGSLGYYLTFTQRIPYYWGGAMPDWTGIAHTWTLALEEQFYLVWPALVLLAGRRWTAPMALGLALASIAARGCGAHHYVLLGRCDGFALGGFLGAMLVDRQSERARRRVYGWAAGLAVLALVLAAWLGMEGHLVSTRSPLHYRVHVTIASLGSFVLVALVALNVGHPWLACLRLRPVGYLGTISYGLYLWHHPITQLSFELKELLGVGPGPVLWAAEIGLSLAAAVVSWHLIEKPILRLKDLVPYQPSFASDPAPPAGERGDALATSPA
jgi:peptidoglycan/LPS O-acetylase OafA/YrhL